MKSLLKRLALDVDKPTNDKDPVRLAFLGGAKSGKTSLISKVTMGSFRETYYPLQQTQPILFTYFPESILSRQVLDTYSPRDTLNLALTSDRVVLSPVVYNSLVSNTTKRPTMPVTQSNGVAIQSSNHIYSIFTRGNSIQSTPILMELIDTPAFNPKQVVPFLEASLYIKLEKDILHNLANEPRQPVSTNPLIVASGASELNGTVDGYYFVYSAVPSSLPPSYDESSGFSAANNENGFDLLPVMKQTLDEAWQEYYTYKVSWESGKESDVFSFKTALRGLLVDEVRKPTPQSRSPGGSRLLDISSDPADPSCPPPIWLVCTHADLPLASPKLIEDGRQLSKTWRCGFLAVDVESDVEEAIALMVRELVERRQLRKNFKKN